MSGPALALMAIAGGLAGSWSGSAAQSGMTAGRAARAGVHSGAGRSIALDAFTATAAPTAYKPSVGGSSGGGGDGARHRATARDIAWRMLGRFRWSARRQFRYLNWLWNRESGWNVYATNPWSGAYGIPQAVPGSKMASAGPHWRTSAQTQIRWGLRYIRDRYGSPHRAWGHEVAVGWY